MGQCFWRSLGGVANDEDKRMYGLAAVVSRLNTSNIVLET